ncbi:MAG: PAS domain S-box protein [Bacteroidales bacterium]|nr:PAS domain S-box protein [Bacteroidales bacterium]
MNAPTLSYRILILDDNVAQLETIKGILEDEGFHIDAFTKFEEAFEFLKQDQSDLAIFDLRMPGISEMDLIGKIKDISATIPVIINTAYGSFDTAKKAVNVGAFAYVEKAGDPYFLIQEVNRAIHNRLEKEKTELEAAVKERTIELEKEIDQRKAIQKALQESEEQYRLIAENASDVIWVIDLNEAKFIYISPSVFKLRGVKPEESLGQPFIETVIPESREEIAKAIEEYKNSFLQDKQNVFKHEVQLIRKNDTPIWVEISAKAIINTSNGHLEVHGSSRDISQRKKAEFERQEALKNEKQRRIELEKLFEGANYILKQEEFIQTARKIFDAACELIGAKSGYVALLSDTGEENEVLFLEAGGKPCNVDPTLPMPIRGLRAEAYKTGKAVCHNNFMNSDWANLMPDGHSHLENVLFAPLNIADKTVGIMGLANKDSDFTEYDLQISEAFSQLAAMALQNSRNLEGLKERDMHFTSLLENPVGYVVYRLNAKMGDNSTNITHVSPSICDVLGISEEQMNNFQAWFANIHPDDLPILIEASNKGQKPPFLLNQEIRFIHPEKGIRWLHINANGIPFADDPQKAEWSNGIILDITERKIAETKLKDSFSELSAIYESIPISVLLIDRDRKIRKSNDSTHKISNCTEEDIFGKRCGELFNCVYHLDHPKGCGFTPMCKDCLVNNSILNTFETKKGASGIEAWIPSFVNRRQKNLCFEISTSYLILEEEEFVLLSANDITNRKNSEKDLLNSEQRFRTFMDSTEDIIFIKDHNFKYIYSNKANDHFIGKSNIEILGKSDLELMPKLLAKHCHKSDSKTLEKNDILIFEEEFDNQTFEVCKFPLFLPNGKKGIGAIIRNITNQKTALDAIKESERRLSTLMANLPGMAYRCLNDKKWTMLFVSSGSTELSGYAPYELINNQSISYGDVIHPEYRQYIWNRIEEHIFKNKSFELEYQIVHKNGSIRWVLERGQAVLGQNGQITALEGFISDITAAKYAELNIKRSEEKFRALAENSIDLIWQMDRKLRFTYLSPALEDLALQSPEEWVGTSFLHHIVRRDFISIAKASLALINQESDFPILRMETYIVDRYEKEIPVEIIAKPIYNNKNEIVGLQGSTRDISERVEAQKAIERSEVKYKKLIETSQNGVALLNMETNFVFLNNRMATLLGYDNYKDLKDKNATQLLTNNEHESLISGKEDELFTTGKLSNFRIDVLKKDGTSLPSEFNITVINDEFGEPELFMIVMHDITYRIEAEKAIRKQAQIESYLAEVSRYLLNPESSILEVSNYIVEHLHLVIESDESYISFDDLVVNSSKYTTNFDDHCIVSSIHGKDAKIALTEYDTPICKLIESNTGVISTSQYFNNMDEIPEFEPFHSKQDEVFNILLCPAFVSDLRLGYIILCNKAGGFTDENVHICKRFAELYGYFLFQRKIQLELTESRERFMQLADNIDSIFFITSPDLSEVIYVSPAIKSIMGIKIEDLQKDPRLWLSNIKKEDQSIMIDRIRKIRRDKNVPAQEIEYRYIKPQGKEIWINAFLFPVYNEKGEIIRIAGTARDITSAKMASRQEMNALIKGEENERSRLSQELHDGLGPLMTTLRLYMQAMERTKDTDKITDIAGKSEKVFYEAVRTLTEISNNLSPHVLKNYGVAEALKYFIEKVRQIHDIEVVYNCSCPNRADDLTETTIYRAICELINNSVKHSGAKKIIINISHESNSMNIRYIDDGQGFNLDEMFKTNKGMGLNNLQNRIRNINGDINFKSAPKKGFEAIIKIAN